MRGMALAALLLALSAGAVQAADYSGTVVTVDREAGTIVVGEIGPWQVKDGKTRVTERTIAVGPSTRFLAAKRSREAGPSGWPGECVEEPLAAWTVTPGDFVTVRTEKAGDRLQAVTVTIAVN